MEKSSVNINGASYEFPCTPFFSGVYVPLHDIEVMGEMFNYRFTQKDMPLLLANSNSLFAPTIFLGYVFGRFSKEDDIFRASFVDFIKKETHYTLERAGWEWNQNKSRFHNPERDFAILPDNLYQSTKDRVLEAFVDSAIDAFQEDRKTLRCSLKDWIK